MQRRLFLQAGLSAGAVSAAIGAGLIVPRAAFAEWSKAAFDAEKVDAAMQSLFGSTATTDAGDIDLKAPDIAENGAVVPISVSSDRNASSITILAESNATPLAATFHLSDAALADVSTRIKMGKTGNVTALVKVGDQLLKTSKEVKVTIGGCGG